MLQELLKYKYKSNDEKDMNRKEIDIVKMKSIQQINTGVCYSMQKISLKKNFFFSFNIKMDLRFGNKKIEKHIS